MMHLQLLRLCLVLAAQGLASPPQSQPLQQYLQGTGMTQLVVASTRHQVQRNTSSNSSS